MVFGMRIPGSAARWTTTLVASALLATLLVLATARGSLVQLAPAATNTRLCSGYSGCIDAGYSDSGYSSANDRMYWNMYSGHNCTNYVAYRVIRAGGPATRPWSGNGNASQWGLRLADLTDQTPNVGAVAWWARYDNGSGSAGHVAIVERVISPTEIIISEDAWGGTFHWRRISQDSGRWPSGFIHITDKRVVPQAPPTVTGTPAVGQVLTAGRAKWSVAPTALSYLWLVGGSSTGITTPTFTLRPGDLGKTVAVRVRAKRAGYTDGITTSPATPAVSPGSFTLAQPPVVTGQPLVDETLTATSGSWKPKPSTVGWRWYADAKLLTANTGPTLELTPTLVGKVITVRPVARTDGYTAAAAPTLKVGTVLMGVIEVTSPLRITGRPQLGQTLEVAGGTTNPADAKRTVQWLRDGIPIAGATAPTYRLGTADVLHRIGVQVNLTRRNYAPASETSSAGLVSSPGTIKVITAGGKRTATVWVSVKAAGVDPVPGTVSIKVGRRAAEEVRLVGGKARIVVDASAGRKAVTVRYLGSAGVPAGTASGSVVVR